MPVVQSWEWSDVLVVGGSRRTQTLSIEDISEMRARDIKRRLARKHGYLAEELASKLDKKELIHALAYEEEKIRLKEQDDLRRDMAWKGTIAAIVAALAVFMWPLIQQGIEILHVNMVVYTDRKKLEARRCWELGSLVGLGLVVVMCIINMMQAWLTASVLLSWVMRSKYFFPVPHIPLRPAQLMGGAVAQSSLANYGLNVGPMAVSWALRFLDSQVETWTGYALSRRYKAAQKEARARETPAERESRRAARRARKAARQEATTKEPKNTAPAPPNLPANWMQPKEPVVPVSSVANDAFLKEVQGGAADLGSDEGFQSVFDELD